MTSVRPRALVHRGIVEAAGLWFDLPWLGVDEARRRILALWSPGTKIYRVADGLCVRWPAPRRIACDRALGLPLVAAGRILTAAPLAADELDKLTAMSPPAGSLALVQGAVAVIEPLLDSVLESPETWCDVEVFAVIEMRSLGSQPDAPHIVAEPEPFDARERLDGVPPEAPELAELLAALRSGKTRGKASAHASDTSRGSLRDWLAQVFGTIGEAASAFKRFITGLGREGKQDRKATHSTRNANTASLSLPLTQQLSVRLKRLLARLLVTTRLAGIIGRRQARYIARMMEMFERGDLDDALRHAIPLGGDAAELLAPAFRLPLARLKLSISPQRTRITSSIGMGEDLLGELRRLYRDSFERLEAQGRIEEAAFVLAELLQANEETVAFLERHGRLQLAAEMAEARELPPGLVVRQWFVAGDKQRALRMARRTGAFADAVMRLEKSNSKEAEILRLLWAGALAEAGNYAAAVDVAWPVTSARRLAVNWMDHAIELGGPSAARMLARKLDQAPEAFDEVRARVLTLLKDDSREGASSRLAFADTLRQGPRTPMTKTLARAAVRAMLRDAGLGYGGLNPVQFRHLIDAAGDGALRADTLPLPVVARESLQTRDSILKIEIADVGTIPIHDAALLPDGRMVAAFGEAGVRLLTRDGRTVAHFDVPAHRLVVSDHGDRVIALAKRGEVWRLARVDFLSRQTEEWCEARVDAFAADYDGSLWFIGARQDFYAIDATAKRFDALWRVPSLDGGIAAVSRSSSSCHFLVNGWEDVEGWAYLLPSLKLRDITYVSLTPRGTLLFVYHCGISSEGIIADLLLYCPSAEPSQLSSGNIVSMEEREAALAHPSTKLFLRLFVQGTLCRELPLGAPHCQPQAPAISANWLAVPILDQENLRVVLVDLKEGEVRAEVLLTKATRAAVRLNQEALTIADDCGRLLALDLNDGRLWRNLRV